MLVSSTCPPNLSLIGLLTTVIYYWTEEKKNLETHTNTYWNWYSPQSPYRIFSLDVDYDDGDNYEDDDDDDDDDDEDDEEDDDEDVDEGNDESEVDYDDKKEDDD